MPRLNGRITPMEDASAVSRDAGNPPVRFDVAGAGDEVMESPKRARSRKRRTQPRGILHTTAPVPDPTAPASRFWDSSSVGNGARGLEDGMRVECHDRRRSSQFCGKLGKSCAGAATCLCKRRWRR
jgi:hypothetical protein